MEKPLSVSSHREVAGPAGSATEEAASKDLADRQLHGTSSTQCEAVAEGQHDNALDTSQLVDKERDEDAGRQKPEAAVAAAARAWLQENKRQEDFRLFARELESLVEEGMAAELLSDSDHSRSLLLTLSKGNRYLAELRSTYCWRLLSASELEKEQREDGLDESADHGLQSAPGAQASAEIMIFGRFGPSSVGVGGEERLIVEFEGRRSSCGLIDKGMSWIDYEAVKELQMFLLPSLPSPLVFLEFLLALPLGARGGIGPVPFRSIILEDMLTTECWEEGSDEDSDDAAAGQLAGLRFGDEACRPKGNAKGADGKGNRSKTTSKGSSASHSDSDNSRSEEKTCGPSKKSSPSTAALEQGRPKHRVKRNRR